MYITSTSANLIFFNFPKMENMFHPTCFSYNLLVIVLHWEMGSTFSPLESEQVCIYSRNDAMWLLRLSHKNFSAFFSLFPDPCGSLSLELNHHALRKPNSHEKIIHSYSGNNQLKSQPTLSARPVRLQGDSSLQSLHTPADAEERGTLFAVSTAQMQICGWNM